MNNLEWYVVMALCIVVFITGMLFGWLYAHHTVANECDKIGGFYVGDRIYECKRIHNIADTEE